MIGRDITTITGGFDADETGVDRFVVAMRRKLTKKRKEGRGGWNLDCEVSFLRALLAEHVGKGDMVDIANLAMMIWNREHPTGRTDD
jgi:hypothetical protein